MDKDQKDEVVFLYLDDIIPNRFQPREVFDEKALKELAVSIKEHGVIQPIIVREVNNKYEIIAGERRYKASALAGMTKIPAIVRNLDDKESSKVALLENLQRKNLTPIEEARTYQKILEIDQMTQEELAKTMGKSQSAVSNKLRLLSLPDEIQDSLLKEQISERHARALLNLTDGQKQKDLMKKIIQNKMSVRAVEEEIKRINSKNQESSSDSNLIKPESRFLINEPLSPTINFEDDDNSNMKNYGEIKVVQPTETEELDFNDINEPVDLNKVIANTTDIKEQDEKTGSLDSMLNLNQSPSIFDYLTPVTPNNDSSSIAAQKSNNVISENNIDSIDLPVTVENYTIETAIDKLRELVEEMKQNNLKVTINEMNFEKTMQVIIKIDKE